MNDDDENYKNCLKLKKKYIYTRRNMIRVRSTLTYLVKIIIFK